MIGSDRLLAVATVDVLCERSVLLSFARDDPLRTPSPFEEDQEHSAKSLSLGVSDE